MNKQMIIQTGVDDESTIVNPILEININKNPDIPKYLAPYLSNIVPIIGDNTKFVAFPGNRTKPASAADKSRLPFK